MKINENLDIVLDIRQNEDGKPTLRVFHVPISRDVFELNYRILSATFSEVWAPGSFHAMSVGPRISSMVLKDVARRQSEASDETPDDRTNPAASFLSEIKRLSMILCPTPSGWEKIPVQSAISKGIIDEEEWQEVESVLVFFTCAFHLAKRSERESRMKILLGLLKGQPASSLSMESTDSLPISMPTGTSSYRIQSSVPS